MDEDIKSQLSSEQGDLGEPLGESLEESLGESIDSTDQLKGQSKDQEKAQPLDPLQEGCEDWPGSPDCPESNEEIFGHRDPQIFDEPQSPPSGPVTAQEWEQEANHFQDLYLRSLAEMENVRRRFEKDREETRRYATEGVIRDVLPLLDNLNLALSYADTEIPAVKTLAQGVEMTLKGCLNALSEHGLKEISVEPGQPFDPNFHEALSQEPSEKLPDKTVSRLVSKGYSLHKRLLKPAKVIVVKNETLN
jgi:molecular chaperone GrpE